MFQQLAFNFNYKLKRKVRIFFAVIHAKQYLGVWLDAVANVDLEASFDIVTREQAGDPVHDPFPPAVVILLEDVDGGAFIEAQLVVFVS